MLKAMKITTAIVLMAALHVSATGVAQKISFSGENVPLTKVFNAIEEQLGLGVLMPHDLLIRSRPVTIRLVNGNLEELLQRCFAYQPWRLIYTMTGHTIYISEQLTPPAQSDLARQPPKTIKVHGAVYDEAGVPLAGANVTIKETGLGTITNAKGEFELQGVTIGNTVTISFIGYTTESIKIKSESSIKFYLRVAKDELDKVVKQAYGVTTHRLTTGDIGTVSAEEIARQPVMNPLQALQGEVPGVVVTNTSGYASGAVKVEIRGRNVIGNFPSDPLYIVDGVPLTILDVQNSDSYQTGSQGVIQTGIPSPANGQSPFFSINPQDIESIEVLKDADATAIYGSRGANGVILVTTKRGKAGKNTFDINMYEGASQVPRYYHMLNTSQYVQMRKEALTNDGLTPDINNAPDLVAWDTTRYTDWQKYLWGGTGKLTDLQASLSGGDLKTTFRLAGSYHRQTEIATRSGADQRGALSFNFNHHSLDDRLKIGLVGNYSVSAADMVNLPTNGTSLPPDAPAVFDKYGNLNYAGWAPLGDRYIFGTLLDRYTLKTYFLNSDLMVNYELAKGLNARTNLGYNNIQTHQTFLVPIASQNPLYNPTGNANYGTTSIYNLIVEPQLEYHSFLGKGKIDMLLGASIQNNTTEGVVVTGSGFINDALLTSVGNAPYQYSNNISQQYKYDAVFSRITFNWLDKYIVNLNARRDGSSKFAPGKQFGDFGSLGAAWIFTEENWVRNNAKFLSFGKLRASYGTTGGDQIGNYDYLSQWYFTNALYNGYRALTPLGLTDSTYHWQVNKKIEFSLELGFLKDRLNLEASFYRDRCDNQLIPFPTPLFTGFQSVTTNSPADVQNIGWEFILKAKIVESKSFAWASNFNLGINRNKLLAYPNLAQSPYASAFIIGKPINIIRELHFTGVDPQTGLNTFQDMNKDGQITIDYTGGPDDRYPIIMDPKYEGSLSNQLTYKNWTLNFTFYFRKQIGQNALISSNIPGDASNQVATVLSRWQKPGDHTTVARFTTEGPAADPSFFNYLYNSDAQYTDASFIRLQNLSLSYQIPQKKKGYIRIYVQGQNLLIITDYKGVDPEMQNFGALPGPRILTTGISCDF